MCICLSLSQEVSEVGARPAAHIRHRRSVSDSVVRKRISLGDLSQHCRTLDDLSICSACRIFPPLTNITTCTTLSSKSSILPPTINPSFFIPNPPPPPPQPKMYNKHKTHEHTFQEEIARYNFNELLNSLHPHPSDSSSSSSNTLIQQPISCSVCFDEAQPKDTILYLPCMHSFCKECVREHIKNLTYTGTPKLSCLANCKSVLPAELARGLMDDATYNLYTSLLRIPAGAHRWCPRAGCDTPYIKADRGADASPQVDCMVKWHDGTTCAEFKEIQNKDKPEEQILSEEYAKQNLQECPNLKIWVEKIDGCEYVMCAACHHEFCWDCLEPHDHNMGAHVHGPRYKPSSNYRRRRPRVNRQRLAVRVAKFAGIGVAACILGPPALALGAAVAVVVLPVLGIHHIAKVAKRKRARKHMIIRRKDQHN